jgi:TonB-dependent receptor
LDSIQGEPVAGVVVSVRGTTLGTKTDEQGRYNLKGVPPGDHILVFSKSGFDRATVADVRVLIGQTSRADSRMSPEFYEMDTYEVVAELFEEQNVEILADRQESSALLDSLGSDYLSRVGAGDAAEALGKVTGASVADGKFAVIRGLADRYTSTTLNGNDLPSADPDRKAAQLDLLPSKFIERIDVRKTFSPDMPGGFAGGAIDIVTKQFSDRFEFSLEAGTSYNTQSSLRDDFLFSDQSSTDWLARDNGKREMPALLANSGQRTTDPVPTPPATDTDLNNSFGSRQFAGKPGDSPLNYGFALSLSAPTTVFGKRLNILFGANYKTEYDFYDDGFVAQYKYLPVPGDPRARFATNRFMNDTRATIEYTLSGIAGLALEVFTNHTVQVLYLHVQTAEDEAGRLNGYFEGPSSEYDDFYVDTLRWQQRSLGYLQLSGNHEFPELNDISLDWAGSLSSTTQEEPDYRVFQYYQAPPEDGGGFYLASAINPQYPSRSWREIQEDNGNLRMDLNVPVPSYNDKDNAVKAGWSLSQSDRTFVQRVVTAYDVRGGSRNTFSQTGDPNDFFQPENDGEYDYRNVSSPGNLTYDGEQEIDGVYLMGDWAALNWLRLVGGARLEHTKISITGIDYGKRLPNGDPGPIPTTPTPPIDQNDLLPSLALTLSPLENVQLRAAWSQTVVRPTYREIADVTIYDFSRLVTIKGNPDLVLSDSENFDLRAEWYPSSGDLVAVSGFMKRIQNPIELVAENPEQWKYVNTPEAFVLGVEAEVRKQLWKPLDALSVGFNAAYIQSEVELTDSQRQNRSQLYGETGDTRPLYDQPSYILNADLTWNIDATRTILTVAGGVVGPRLIVLGERDPDQYEEPAPQLDVFVTQQLGKNFKVKLFAKNLLDPTYEVTQTFPAFQGRPEGTVVVDSHTKGITLGLTLGYDF